MNHERELAACFTLYLKMNDTETKDEALDRLLEKLDMVGIEWCFDEEYDVEVRDI